jgi:PAS domain S-box-containing protein
MIETMIIAEQQGLLLHCQAKLSALDWTEIHQEMPRYGNCLIEPGKEYKPLELVPRQPHLDLRGEPELRLSTGHLSPDQLECIFAAIPADITFVDQDDRVAYYNDPPERVFSRCPGIIGRKVQKCHPPDSVHAVEKILEAFKNGKRDSAEFWIQLGGKFILIKYFPLRDGNGYYKGCLEVSQDITEIRQLEGEKRLLDDSF